MRVNGKVIRFAVVVNGVNVFGNKTFANPQEAIRAARKSKLEFFDIKEEKFNKENN